MNEHLKPEDALKAALGKSLQETKLRDGIAGNLLTFKKGEWFRGQEKTLVPRHTRFRPNPWEAYWGWQKFEDKRMTGLILCRVIEGQPPERTEIADLDQSQWEDGRDPWQMNSRFIFQDMDGSLVTFSTVSFGGRQACEDLLKAYRDDKEHPGLWPVVGIDTEYFMSREYGQIAKPKFTIVDWMEPWAPPSGNLITLPAPTSRNGGNGAKTIEAPKANNTFEAPARFEYELDEEAQF